MADVLIAPRPAPATHHGWRAWLRTQFAASPASALTSVLMLMTLLWLLPDVWSWAVTRAQFSVDACRAAHAGACWGVVLEKYRLILLGRYPLDEAWRPVVAMLLLLSMVVASCVRRCWRPVLLPAWLVALILVWWFMHGGLGLSRVDTDRWGGLPLTILLSTLSIALAFPIAVLVALGRRSDWPAVRTVCATYVEVVRGVPLVSVLFMASFMFPLLLPQGLSVDVLVRVLAGISLFAGAYMAEVVRGGLQALPQGQTEAAASLGLSYWQTQRRIVLPQALATVLPGLMNNFIAIFKDTSLVTIVSLYELTGSLGLALNSDADWRPFKLEAYLFIAMIYFVFCWAMSRYAMHIEQALNRGRA